DIADRMAGAARSAHEAELQAALAEAADSPGLEAAARAHPLEVARIHDDRLFVTRRGIFHLAAHHMLPYRLVAVLANGPAIGRRSGEDAALETPVIAQPLIAVVELVVAHEAEARRPAHLQQQRHRLHRLALRPIERSFGKIADRAGL